MARRQRLGYAPGSEREKKRRPVLFEMTVGDILNSLDIPGKSDNLIIRL
jgi:hypothetical protein